MVGKEILKEIYLESDWFVEIEITHDYSPTIKIQYFGNDDLGAFNFYWDFLPEQKRFKYVPFEKNMWLKIVNVLKDFVSVPIDKRQEESGFDVNAIYYIKVKTPDENYKIELNAIYPNKLTIDFANWLLGICPLAILKDERFAKYYYF